MLVAARILFYCEGTPHVCLDLFVVKPIVSKMTLLTLKVCKLNVDILRTVRMPCLSQVLFVFARRVKHLWKKGSPGQSTIWSMFTVEVRTLNSARVEERTLCIAN